MTRPLGRTLKVIILNFNVRFKVQHLKYLHLKKGTVNFNHYHGCGKCTTLGEWDKKGHHMSFPRIDAPRRSDFSFRSRSDEDHHKIDSPIEELKINMVEDFPVADSLHLLDLGIMKKCLIGWTLGSFNFSTKWSAKEIDEISDLLVSFNKFKPNEIHRAIRKLDCLKFWKGLEFRTFLLYLGIVILKDYLPTEAYQHFVLLFCGVTICSTKSYIQYTDLADRLFSDYIEGYINIYGIDSITSNVHNLCHVVDDVKRFGPLPEISAYPFENRLGYIKKLLRNGHRPLAQVAKRMNELSNSEHKIKNNKKYPRIYNEEKNVIEKKQFKAIEVADGFTIARNDRDKWFLTLDNNIIAMEHAYNSEEKICVLGKRLKKLIDFFERPFKSSRLNIYLADINKYENCTVNVESIKCKLFALPYKNHFVFVPLLHTLDS